MSAPEVLLEGVVFGESPRWHDGRLWFSDCGANQVIALGLDGSHEVRVTDPSFPMCIDFPPDGRLLVVDSAKRRLLRCEPNGSLVTHADLSGVSVKPWNEIVVDNQGNAYVNTIGFDFPGGEFRPGLIVVVTPEGDVRQVADNVAFPNGMAITSDGLTLIVAESYGNQITAFDIGVDGGSPIGECGQTRPGTTQTGSALMPRVLSGMPMWQTNAACVSARVAA
jgi:sugar lactone lactonase YvrE